MQTNRFKFSLGQEVTIAVSGETGVITGRAEYLASQNSYYLRHKAADGRAVQAWWEEDALSAAEATCGVCGGTGQVRRPYSTEFEPCAACASRPNSTASVTTDASANPSGNNA